MRRFSKTYSGTPYSTPVICELTTIAARYGETASIPRYLKSFYTRHQKKLLYGTDMGMDPGCIIRLSGFPNQLTNISIASNASITIGPCTGLTSMKKFFGKCTIKMQVRF